MKVIVSRTPLDPGSYVEHETDDLAGFLYREFEGKKPETLRLFNGQPCDEHEVTPRTPREVEALNELDGPVYALVWPAGPAAVAVAIVVASVAVGVAAALLLRPPMPTQRAANFNQPSPNNELSARENVPRIGKRIEDIYGTVRSTPSLIAVPYTIFEANREVEVTYSCVGRGSYSISDIRDGDTPISRIAGASAEVYGPNTSPNAGAPQLTVGPAINKPVRNVRRNGAVNGQTLQAPNASGIQGLNLGLAGEISFVDPSINPAAIFSVSDEIQIAGSGFFDGTWTITFVSSSLIIVNDIGWPSDPGVTGTYLEARVITEDVAIGVGPFVVEDADEIWINYVALNGLWKSDGETQEAVNVDIEATFTALDGGGNPTGTPEVINRTILGSFLEKGTIGVTEVYTPSVSYPLQVQIKRVTATDKTAGTTVQDEVKARDLYAVSEVTQGDFGNVTTIMTQTFATDGALAVKERRLNCLARRLIPKRNTDGTFTAPGTDYNVRDVLIAVAKDPFIGGRIDAEIDAAGIAAAITESLGYFGSSDAVNFDYTFDDDNISFEETWFTIASANFLIPYRQGRVLKVKLDRAQDSSAEIFTHRNMVPRSMTRTVRFGRLSDHDGVELDYVDPSDDSVRTIFIPADQSAVNPRRVETVGVRSRNLAYWHAAREYNQILYQNTYVDFEALEQANLVTRLDRILVADQTRQDTSDGEVVAQDGLTLTLSQPHAMQPGEDYAIYLMYADGSVGSIDIEPGPTDRQVVLQSAPTGTIVTDTGKVALTNYIISRDGDPRVMAFLVSEKTPQGGAANLVGLKGFNYDARYYANDGDPAP